MPPQPPGELLPVNFDWFSVCIQAPDSFPEVGLQRNPHDTFVRTKTSDNTPGDRSQCTERSGGDGW